MRNVILTDAETLRVGDRMIKIRARKPHENADLYIGEDGVIITESTDSLLKTLFLRGGWLLETKVAMQYCGTTTSLKLSDWLRESIEDMSVRCV